MSVSSSKVFSEGCENNENEENQSNVQVIPTKKGILGIKKQDNGKNLSPKLTIKTNVIYDENLKENNSIDSSGSSGSQQGKNNKVVKQKKDDAVIEKISTPEIQLKSTTPFEENAAPIAVNKVDFDASFPGELPPESGVATSESTGTVAERLISKTWSIRKDVYESLKGSFSSSSFSNEDMELIQNNLKNVISDSHSGAQISGVEMVEAWINCQKDPIPSPVALEITNLICEKCFSQAARTQSLASSLLLSLSRKSDKNSIVESLLAGCKSKKKKIPPECVKVVKLLILEYGLLSLPTKAIISELNLCFQSPDNVLKASATELACEMYKWIREPLRTMLKGLKSSQEKELFTLFDGLASHPTPIPLCKKGTHEEMEINGGSTGKSNSIVKTGNAGGVDAWDFVEAVDILSILHKSDFNAKLAEEKWSTKVEGLKFFIDKSGVPPKVVEGDYNDLVSTFMAIIARDKNAQVQAHAVQCLGVLAHGLRKPFSSFARNHSSTLLALYKDKNKALLSSLDSTLDAFVTHCFKLSDISDAINTHVNSTNPQIQQFTLSWLNRSLSTHGEKCCPHNYVKTITALLNKSLNASTPAVKDISCDCLISLISHFGVTEPSISNMLTDLKTNNSRVYKKVETMLPNKEVSTSLPPEAVVKESAPVITSKPKSSSAPPTKLAVDKNKTVTPRAVVASGTSNESKISKGDMHVADDLGVEMTFEDAQEKLSSCTLIDNWPKPLEAFSAEDSKWQDKQAAFDAISQAAVEHGQSFAPFGEATLVYLSKKTSGWKIANFALAQSAFKVPVAIMNATILPKRVVQPLVATALSKIGDKKLSPILSDIVMVSAECLGPKYLIEECIASVEKIKTPVLLQAILDLMKQLVTDFGARASPIAAIIKHTKTDRGLECSNAAVRTSAINLLGEIYRQVGPTVRDMVAKDCKDSLLATIEKHFSTITFDPKAVANRAVRGATPDDIGNSNDNFLDQLNPRVDITNLISASTLNDMNSMEGKDSWKIRNAALENVASILEKNKRIEYTTKLSVIIKSLKLRLSDTNGNLKIKSLKNLALLSTAVGVKIAGLNKLILSSIFLCLSENKKAIVNAAVETLTSWVNHEGEVGSSFASLLPFLTAPMENLNGRLELLEWMILYIPECKSPLDSLISPTLCCLQDKNASVRSLAEKILGYIIASAEESALEQVTRDLKPAILRALNSHIANAVSFSKTISTKLDATVTPNAEVNETITVSVSLPAKETIENTSKVFKPSTSTTGVKKVTKVEAAVINEQTSTNMAVPPIKSGGIGISTIKDIENRRKKNLRQRWVFEEVRPEFKNSLMEEMEGIFNAKLIENLFRTDPKAMKESFDVLTSALELNPETIVSNLDLVLKWMTLQMVGRESAVSTQKQSDFLLSLFTHLKKIKYTMDDTECTYFLSYLIEKLGHPKIRFRQSYQESLILIQQMYPASKYSPFLLEALTSKNTRTKCGAIENLTRVTRENGWKTVGRKGLDSISHMVDHEDKDVRTAAVDCLEAVWKQLDQDSSKFYEMVKNVSAKAKGIIDEHFKYHASTTSTASSSNMAHVENQTKEIEKYKDVISSESQPSMMSDVDASIFNFKVIGDEEDININASYTPSPLSLSSLPETDVFNFKRLSLNGDFPTPKPTITSISNLDKTPSLPKPSPSLNILASPLISAIKPKEVKIDDSNEFYLFQDKMNKCFDYFTSFTRISDASDSHPCVIDGIQVCKSLVQMSDSNPKKFKLVFVPFADEVMNIILKGFGVVWGKAVNVLNENDVDVKDHMVNVLLVSQLIHVCFKILEFASTSLSLTTLKNVFTFCLHALTDTRLKWPCFQGKIEAFHGMDTLLGCFNNLTIQGARLCDLTLFFCSMIEILSDSKSISSSELAIVGKLISKVVRLEEKKITNSNSTIPFESCDYQTVLYSFNSFFSMEGHNSVAYEMVYSLLHKLVLSKGSSISNDLTQFKKSPLIQLIKNIVPIMIEDEDGNIKELDSILLLMSKEVIAASGDNNEGIKKLIEFKKLHPEVDVEKKLSSVPSDFQKIIRKEMLRYENNEKGESASNNNNNDNSGSAMTILQQRLTNLRTRYNMTGDASSAESSVVVDSVQNKLAAVKASLLSSKINTQATPLKEKEIFPISTITAAVSSSTTAPPQIPSTLSDLRARIQRLNKVESL